MRKMVALIGFLISLSWTLHAYAPTFHAGLSGSIGFFSCYSSGEVGIKVALSKTIALGLTQRLGYGFTYSEVVGMTELRTYVYDDLFFHIGASYLLIPAANAQVDFNTNILPYMGFGLYIPLDSSRRFYVVPRIEMNQSFYLSDEVRPNYTDLPFVIAMQGSLAFEYRLEHNTPGVDLGMKDYLKFQN